MKSLVQRRPPAMRWVELRRNIRCTRLRMAPTFASRLIFAGAGLGLPDWTRRYEGYRAAVRPLQERKDLRRGKSQPVVSGRQPAARLLSFALPGQLQRPAMGRLWLWRGKLCPSGDVCWAEFLTLQRSMPDLAMKGSGLPKPHTAPRPSCWAQSSP